MSKLYNKKMLNNVHFLISKLSKCLSINFINLWIINPKLSLKEKERHKEYKLHNNKEKE